MGMRFNGVRARAEVKVSIGGAHRLGRGLNLIPISDNSLFVYMFDISFLFVYFYLRRTIRVSE